MTQPNKSNTNAHSLCVQLGGTVASFCDFIEVSVKSLKWQRKYFVIRLAFNYNLSMLCVLYKLRHTGFVIRFGREITVQFVCNMLLVICLYGRYLDITNI